MPAKPKFDPNKPFEEVKASKPAFDPNKPFEEVSSRPRSKYNEFESGVAGAAQGFTGGWAEEGDAAILATVDKLKRGGSWKEHYNARLAEQRKMLKETQEDNPKSFFAGSAVGAVGSSTLPGLSITKATKFIPAVGKATALGAATGAGLSEADTAAGVAKDAAIGGLTAGALQGAFTGASKAFNAFKPSITKDFAERKALSAAGFMKKDLNKLSQEQQKSIGRELLDKKVVTAFASLDDVAERSAALKKSSGEAIGKALGKVDDLVTEAKASIDSGKLLPGLDQAGKEQAKKYLDDNFQFSMKRIGERIRSDIVEKNKNIPDLKNEVAKAAALADDYMSKASTSLEFGNTVKRIAGKKTKFASETVPEMFRKDIYGIIKEELEDVVGKTGNLEAGLAKLGGFGQETKRLGGISLPEVAKRNAEALSEYKSAKLTNEAAKTALKASQDRMSGQAANRTFGLTDTIAGAAGFATGTGGPGAQTARAAAFAGLNKIARKYGSSVQAVSADKLADGIQAIISKSPETLRRVSPMLEEFAKKGNKSLVAAHVYLMENDRAYRDLMTEADKEQPGNAFERRLKQIEQEKGAH